jgi:hypothetical protein
MVVRRAFASGSNSSTEAIRDKSTCSAAVIALGSAAALLATRACLRVIAQLCRTTLRAGKLSSLQADERARMSASPKQVVIVNTPLPASCRTTWWNFKPNGPYGSGVHSGAVSALDAPRLLGGSTTVCGIGATVSLLPVDALQGGLDTGLQQCQMIRDCVPDGIEIDPIVLMAEPVSDAPDITPWPSGTECLPDHRA